MSEPGMGEAEKKGERTVFVKRLITVFVCAMWMVFSSTLILLNNHLMTKDHFHYPMTLSGMGMAFSGFASFLCCRVFKIVEAKKRVSTKLYLTRILPVGFFMACTLHFGNWAYLRLTVSFIQMLKAFTPVTTMVFLFVAGLETPNRILIGSTFLISGGTAVAAFGEANFEIWGFAAMCVSECAEAARLVMTQTLLQNMKFAPIEGLMYLGPACTFWLLVGAMGWEWPRMQEEGGVIILAAKPLTFLFAASLGFCVNGSAYCVIQLASSLTLKVLGTVKNGVIVLLGVLLLGNEVGLGQASGYLAAVVGFGLYNYAKMIAPPGGGKEKDAPAVRVPLLGAEGERDAESGAAGGSSGGGGGGGGGTVRKAIN